MKAQEAKQRLDEWYTDNNVNISPEVLDCCYKAIEKQIPKKITIYRYIYTKCDCGYEFSKHYGDGYYDVPFEKQTKYCPKCGQALDWSDTE